MKKNFNKNELIEILDLKNVKSIYEVIGRMEILIDFFESTSKYNSLAPFTKTYFLVTKKVSEYYLNNKKYFENFDQLESLDITFAQAYFSPLKQFILEDKLTTPWKTYFEYCGLDTRTPFIEMLLGINAHINGDLSTSLFKVNYKSLNDFKKINDILLETIPEVFIHLAFHEHDFLGLGGLVFKNLVIKEFKDLIVMWRKNAWKNYEKLKDANFNKQKKEMYFKTEEVGKDLISLFVLKKFINLKGLFSSLNETKVIIKN